MRGGSPVVRVAGMEALAVDSLSTLYRALAEGDRRQALEALTADVEWVIGGSSALAGAYQGRDEVGALWSRMAHLGCLPRCGSIVRDGERAVVLSRVGSDDYEADVVDVFSFESGLVCRYLGIGYDSACAGPSQPPDETNGRY